VAVTGALGASISMGKIRLRLPGMSGKPIRILCVDDHYLVRAGIVRIVSFHPDLSVVAEASTGVEAVHQFMRYKPDVTLMDLRLPGMSGLESIRTIRRMAPEARIVVLTMYDGDQDIVAALDAGAMGYLLKDGPPDMLVQAIHAVHEGHQCIPPDVEARLQARANQPALTVRETEVIELLAQGMRNKEIGLQLKISTETVRVHVKSAFRKFNVHDRTAALTEALKRGIVFRN
jgi:DNA-binding NarL/FixJ family response regulator